MAYDNGTVACTEDELVIRRYYFPRGDKRIPYRTTKGVRRVPLDSRRRLTIEATIRL